MCYIFFCRMEECLLLAGEVMDSLGTTPTMMNITLGRYGDMWHLQWVIRLCILPVYLEWAGLMRDVVGLKKGATWLSRTNRFYAQTSNFLKPLPCQASSHPLNEWKWMLSKSLKIILSIRFLSWWARWWHRLLVEGIEICQIFFE